MVLKGKIMEDKIMEDKMSVSENTIEDNNTKENNIIKEERPEVEGILEIQEENNFGFLRFSNSVTVLFWLFFSVLPSCGGAPSQRWPSPRPRR